ncbi:hypothetical protein [Rhodopirellula europaea]|uniref:hypothetical protein n=1 Tax=Rhodopirellula europaea TaxID=1263866 RepID=UPI003D2A3D54|tara:strand:- start:777 stop:1271 length:495 start_codon:yes stop_codon:yes gene_type:complete
MRRRRATFSWLFALSIVFCIGFSEPLLKIGRALNRSRIAASAPTATDQSPSIGWSEDQIVGWQYSLVSESRIANFGFYAEAGTASIGGPPKTDLPHLGIKAGDPEIMEVEMCGVYWRVTPAGSLSLTVPDTDYSAELRLVYLDDQVASVWNVTRSESEVYIRSR